MKVSEKLYGKLADLQTETLQELTEKLNETIKTEGNEIELHNDFTDDSDNRLTGFIFDGNNWQVIYYGFHDELGGLSLGDAIFLIGELEAGLYEIKGIEAN